MEILIQGLEFTNQLHLHLLQNKNNFLQDFEESALDLTTKIHQSFTDALSLFNTCSANNSIDDGTSSDGVFIDNEILSNNPVISANNSIDDGTSWDGVFIDNEILSNNPVISANNSIDDGTSWDGVFIDNEILSNNPVITGISSDNHWKITDQYSGESKNKAIPGSSTDHDDLKVGCKRRKSNSHLWVRVTPTAIDDGHAWRKYGQKVIHNKGPHNNHFPRSYYRCTHRKEQGCQATKHVQKTQDKPSMFQTTYMGHHTCKETASILNAIPDLMLDENDPSDQSSCVINFQTNLATNSQPFTFSSSSFNTSVTEHESIKHNITTSHDPPSDHDLTFLLADLTAYDSISREVL